VSPFLTLNSYAKINLTLDVLSRRPDGYHNLASVMQTISLTDRLHVARKEGAGITLHCRGDAAPEGPENLVWRAAEAALEAGRSREGVEITLEKQIPAQAGLGGGSSNAAAALLAVNLVLNLGLDAATLMRLAGRLGADVPFFLTGGTASVRGIGERVRALPDCPPLWLVVVKPPVGVSTAAAYSALDAVPDRQSARATRDMEAAIESGDWERVVRRMTNDFERVVLEQHLEIAMAHDDLMMARAVAARLCGSGSAVFGVAEDEAHAHAIAQLLRRKYAVVHVCQTLARSEAVSPSEAEA
jgi:4-diphosphocytidyl-2-C-methyl-D-erythritol kinase